MMQDKEMGLRDKVRNYITFFLFLFFIQNYTIPDEVRGQSKWATGDNPMSEAFANQMLSIQAIYIFQMTFNHFKRDLPVHSTFRNMVRQSSLFSE